MPATPGPNSQLDTLEQSVFQLTNQERAKSGLTALVANATLMTVARGRSQDMATRNYFDHVNPDGKTVFDLLRALGFAYTSAGENIAYNYDPISSSPQQVMTAWMNSSGHRANILNTSYGRLVVGAWICSDGRIYYTQDFTN